MIGRWERGYAVIAGAVGLLLIGALFIGAVVLEWNSLTSSWRDDPWRIVLFGFAAAPFAAALLAAFAADDRPVLRASLLGAAASMGFLAMLLAAASVGFVLLPLVLLLMVTTALAVSSLRRSGIGDERSATAMLAGVLPTLWLFGAASLFVFSANDGRCWEFTRYADGTTTRTSIPYSNSSSGSAIVAPGVVEQGQTCSSDVVTAREGVAGLAFLATGIALTAFVARPTSGGTSASIRRTPAVTRG